MPLRMHYSKYGARSATSNFAIRLLVLPFDLLLFALRVCDVGETHFFSQGERAMI